MNVVLTWILIWIEGVVWHLRDCWKGKYKCSFYIRKYFYQEVETVLESTIIWRIKKKKLPAMSFMIFPRREDESREFWNWVKSFPEGILQGYFFYDSYVKISFRGSLRDETFLASPGRTFLRGNRIITFTKSPIFK